VLNPGDVSVHHPNIIHGSEGNTSDMRRAGLTIRYIPTTTRITADKGCPMVLRGEPVEGINEYLPFPKFKEGEHMPFRGCENWK
jgi:ectoine hydroxylase-related dioxygenase (phytanoyl-CoA dioxygenase family)